MTASDDITDEELVAYMGTSVLQPKNVLVESIELFGIDDLDDLINQVVEFRKRNAGYDLRVNLSEGDRFSEGDAAEASIYAWRNETEDERRNRIDKGKRQLRDQKTARRRQYEELKSEFEMDKTHAH